MENSTVTLFVGIAGIVGTLASSLIGHYYTAKARKSAYQEQLFTEQLAILKRIHVELGHLKDVVPLMVDKDFTELQRVENDAKLYASNLVKLNNEASAVLPSELWVDLNQLVKEVCGFYSKPVQSRTQEDVQKIASITGVITIGSRRLLGVDEMTRETTRLITNITTDQLISSEGREEMYQVARDRLKK